MSSQEKIIEPSSMNEYCVNISARATTQGNQDSAERIAMLIENDLLEHSRTINCNGELSVNQFESSVQKTSLAIRFHGTIDGENFDLHENYSNVEEKSDVGWAFFRNPVVGIIVLLLRGLTESQNNDLSKAEFAIADNCLATLRALCVLPADEEKENWIRNSARFALIPYLAVALTLGILTFLRFQDPGDVLGRRRESLGEQILLCLLVSVAFAIPAAIGGLSAGLLFWLPKNVETSVQGQALLRRIGVSSKVGLITACVFGLIVGVGFSTVLIWFSLQRH